LKVLLELKMELKYFQDLEDEGFSLVGSGGTACKSIGIKNGGLDGFGVVVSVGVCFELVFVDGILVGGDFFNALLNFVEAGEDGGVIFTG